MALFFSKDNVIITAYTVFPQLEATQLEAVASISFRMQNPMASIQGRLLFKQLEAVASISFRMWNPMASIQGRLLFKDGINCIGSSES